ncbi:hypothetical protein CRUP_013733 [Coryphaenoides rupestris]|nr:hypothetical protein CRUP_013733 [Coryphaenoides rupestris]
MTRRRALCTVRLTPRSPAMKGSPDLIPAAGESRPRRYASSIFQQHPLPPLSFLRLPRVPWLAEGLH